MKMKFVDEIWGGNYWLEVSIAITYGLKLYVVTQDLAWIGHGSAPSCNLCYNYFLSYQLPNKRIHAGVGTLSWVILLNCSINKSCYHRVRYHVFLDLKKKKNSFWKPVTWKRVSCRRVLPNVQSEWLAATSNLKQRKSQCFPHSICWFYICTFLQGSHNDLCCQQEIERSVSRVLPNVQSEKGALFWDKLQQNWSV